MIEPPALPNYDTSLAPLSIEQLQTFQAIVEAGTFTRAAESLFLTQSAVSQRVKRLEEMLGVELFDRRHGGRDLRLTPAGDRVLQFAAGVLGQLDQLHVALQEHQTPSVDEAVTIVSTAPIARALVPLLDTFHEHYPHVRVTVVHNPSDTIGEMVSNGKAELATQFTEWATGRLHRVSVLRDQVVLVARSNHPILSGPGPTLRRLVDTYFVLPAPDTYFRYLTDRWASSLGLRLEGALESYSYDLMREAILHRVGIAVMPRWLVYEELRSGLLSIVPVTGLPREFEVCLIADAGRPLSAAARALLQVAREGTWRAGAPPGSRRYDVSLPSYPSWMRPIHRVREW